MSSTWRHWLPAGTVLILFSVVCNGARNSHMLREERRLQSSCPSDPLELCDFYFEGSSSSLPVISLDGSPDTGVGPFIVDSKSGSTVQVGNTGAGSLLCPGSEGTMVGNQFYANGQQAQVRFRTFNQPRSLFENQCLLLPLLAVQIGSANLNPGDGNQATYPEARRCVVFTTGPNGGSSECGTGVSPPSLTPPAPAPEPSLPAPGPSSSPLFPAIFAFGDSTVDVGTNNFLAAAFTRANFLPYGQDFIPASGRFSNGKLPLDFIAEAVGLPSPPPFIQPNAIFLYGANFASAASGVLDSTFCANDTLCFSLNAQLAQFALIQPLYRAEVLAESLFFLSSGGNDYFQYLVSPTLQQQLDVEAYVTAVITGLSASIQALYQLGGRKMIVFDAPALGCLPNTLANSNVSETSPQCVESVNTLAAVHSAAVDTVLAALRQGLPDLAVIKGKAFNFIVAATAEPTLFGLTVAYQACCGGGPFNGIVVCGLEGSTTCPNPEEYLFWDTIHPTQAAYAVFAQSILTGSNSALVEPFGLLTLAEQ